MYVASRLVSGQLSEAAGAVVTQTDLNELERLNRENIHALKEIVGYHGRTETEHELRRRGSQNGPSKGTFIWDTMGHSRTPLDTMDSAS